MTKVTCWAVGDGPARMRKGAWEVTYPDGTGQICCAIFTGPRSKERAQAYAERLRITEDDDLSLEDLLS